jgi:hypothetical protein
VVPIGAAARDVQKQIQFGRGGHIVQRFHGWIITTGWRWPKTVSSAVQRDAQHRTGAGFAPLCADAALGVGR